MTTAKRRVLVAIKDVAYPPRLELRKAAELARAVNARIELYHVVAPARGGDAEPLSRARARLEQFSKQAVFQGLTVSTHVDAGNPPHEAIVGRAISTRAHFVVLAMRARGWFSRLLLSNTDWEVIRQCPCPVLLIRSRREYAGSPVIAAIDPFHTHAKPADLDWELLELSRTLAKKFHGTVHIAHVYTPLVNSVPFPVTTGAPAFPPPEVTAEQVAVIEKAVAQAGESAGVPPAAQHLRVGLIAAELCAVARDTAAGMIVMGAVSRSAVRRMLLGSTAEEVLDLLPCDALVVKPCGFKSALRGRRAPAVRARGLPRQSLSARQAAH